MSEDWSIRPRSSIGHYCSLLSPFGVAAGRIFASDHPGDRVRAIRDQRASGRSRSQRGLVVGPGGRIGWRSVPDPRLMRPCGAIVRPLAVATCDMDRLIMTGASPFPLPLHFGHECVAEVLEIGDSVETVAVGDRVVVPFQINCGTCAACLRGHTASCSGVPAISMYGFGWAGGPWGGVIADRVGVPFADAMLVPLPPGISPVAAASVADNVSDAYRHIGPHLPDLLRRGREPRVVILAGLERRPRYTASNPLYAGMIALALGAKEVELVDSRPQVRRLADLIGLSSRKPSEVGGIRPAALVVEITGRASGLRAALECAEGDGVISSAGGLHHSGRFPLMHAYMRNVAVYIGRTHARAVIPHVLELMASGRISPEVVNTTVAPIDEAPQALHEHLSAAAVKTILVAQGAAGL